MLTTATAPVASILPGGCYHPLPTNPSGCWDTRPVDPKPIDRNCWDPRTWGTPIQLPSPDAEIQAVESAKLLG